MIPQYGASGYWIDFAVQHPTSGRLVLALECDGATYHLSGSARDRDRLRQEQLERIGWRFHRVWSTEWFHHKEAAIESVMAAYETAVRAADQPQETVAPPPSTAQVIGHERGSRPRVVPGLPIYEYSEIDLIRLVRWIESDGLLWTEAELVQEVMGELDFERRGSRIVATITAAIRRARLP